MIAKKLARISVTSALLLCAFASSATTYTYRLPVRGLVANGEAGGGGAATPPVDPTWTQVLMAGNTVSDALMVIAADGGVWSKGYNGFGQLGNGTTTTVATWTKVENNAVRMQQDRLRSAIIKADGSLWVTGNNGNGELGLNDTTNRTVFTQVPGMSNVAKVTHGDSTMFVLKTDGTLWSSGNNYYSQRGVPGAGGANSRVFVQHTSLPLPAGVRVVDIEHQGASYTSMILDSEGNVWGAGYDNDGTLGMGPTQTYAAYTKIPYFSNNATAIAMGNDFSAVLTNDGVVHTTGRNGSSQLGRGSRSNSYTAFAPAVSNVVSMVAGRNSLVVRKSDGSIWSTNYSTENQGNMFGQPPGFFQWSNATNVTSFGVGASYFWMVKNDGSLWMPEVYFNGSGTWGLKQYKFQLP